MNDEKKCQGGEGCRRLLIKVLVRRRGRYAYAVCRTGGHQGSNGCYQWVKLNYPVGGLHYVYQRLRAVPSGNLLSPCILVYLGGVEALSDLGYAQVSCRRQCLLGLSTPALMALLGSSQ